MHSRRYNDFIWYPTLCSVIVFYSIDISNFGKKAALLFGGEIRTVLSCIEHFWKHCLCKKIQKYILNKIYKTVKTIFFLNRRIWNQLAFTNRGEQIHINWSIKFKQPCKVNFFLNQLNMFIILFSFPTKV